MGANPKAHYDSLGPFPLGINSGVEPLLLPKTQASFAINSTFRGGYISHRPPFQKQTLNFNDDTALQTAVEDGFYQGGWWYRPDFGASQLIAQISGRLFAFTPSTTGTTVSVTEITISGDPNSASSTRVWMWQSEKWLIITDGSEKLPIFYDGVSCRRSYGPSVALATTTAVGSFPNPRVIGETVTVTLTVPYTGPYNVPVIFNGHLYQTQQIFPGGLNATLTNGSDTPASVVTSGTSVVVKPSYVGRISSPAIGVKVGFMNETTLEFPFAHGLSVGQNVYLPVPSPLNTSWSVKTVLSTTSVVVQTFPAIIAGVAYYGIGGILVGGSLITLIGSTAPDVILGTTQANFTVPAVGANVDINLSPEYTGPTSQVVWVNEQEYAISPIGALPPSVTLDLINMTDTTDAGAAIPAEDILSVPELPAGRMGAYIMQRNVMSLVDGLSFIVGDIVGAPSGTPVNNYRDSVLKTTENDFLAGGGTFRVPTAGNIINSITATANLDTAYGQGMGQIGTDTGMWGLNLPTDRTEWASLTNPLLPASMLGYGPMAQLSTILSNSDVIFRYNEGIGSLKFARREFNDDMGGNTPISREMERLIALDEKTLLPFGSAITFDNRLLMTLAPTAGSQGVYHVGLTALNFDLISNLRGKAPPIYDGAWSGLNTLQLITGNFSGTGRSYVFGYHQTNNKIELYEILTTTIGGYDNGVTPIQWNFETPIIFRPEERDESEIYVRLTNGQMSVRDVVGTVRFRILYRPENYPCWIDWIRFSICADTTVENGQPGYRTSLGFGEPSSEPCETGNNRPMRVGKYFQVRVEVEGSCKIMSMDFESVPSPTVMFAPPVCEPLCNDLLPLPT